VSNFVLQPGMPFDGIEFYTIHYHRCVRFLLYPQLAENPVNMTYLKLCADACAGVTTDYRRLHHVFPVGFSALSIQSVFLAGTVTPPLNVTRGPTNLQKPSGLTLIYCAWLAPAGYLDVNGPLTDCQILLYIITERYPSARKYRDIFERIKTAMLDLMASGGHRPRDPVAGLDASDMRARVATLDGTWGLGGIGADFTTMISQITGQPMSIDSDSAAGGYMQQPGAMDASPEQQGQTPGDLANLWGGIPVDGLQGEGMINLDGMGGVF
jgi:hypothetical protein